ncbi:hypothetical protein EPN81_03805 [Patescibacteria group bacterium]|nr:MAG: hypothetical protein EPN81_03805 [Patescibacteria group bacterium]
MQSFFRYLFLVSILFLVVPLVSFAVTSTSFEIDVDPDSAASQKTTSDSFQLESTFEPMVGSTFSSSFSIEQGSAFPWMCGDGFVDPDEECETGGTGSLNGQTCTSRGYYQGTLSCASNCTFNTSGCSYAGAVLVQASGSFSVGISPEDQTTYATLFLLFGSKSSDAKTVLVNGSEEDVKYPTSTSWQAWVFLSLGENTFTITQTGGRASSQEVQVTITRLVMADITADGIVDDYDLSLLATAWGSDDPLSDLNEDGVVDDYDLSILAARWSVTSL